MNTQEILATRFGELTDMIACQAIFNGAEPKRRAIVDFDAALRLE